MGKYRRKNWKVITLNRAWAQINRAPLEIHDQALHYIVDKLPFRALPRGSDAQGTKARGVIDPIKAGQTRNRKVQHVRLGPEGSLWRLNFVTLPKWREAYVCECVEHVWGSELYSAKHIRRLLNEVRAFRKNPGVGL